MLFIFISICIASFNLGNDHTWCSAHLAAWLWQKHTKCDQVRKLGEIWSKTWTRSVHKCNQMNQKIRVKRIYLDYWEQLEPKSLEEVWFWGLCWEIESASVKIYQSSLQMWLLAWKMHHKHHVLQFSQYILLVWKRIRPVWNISYLYQVETKSLVLGLIWKPFIFLSFQYL